MSNIIESIFNELLNNDAEPVENFNENLNLNDLAINDLSLFKDLNNNFNPNNILNSNDLIFFLDEDSFTHISICQKSLFKMHSRKYYKLPSHINMQNIKGIILSVFDNLKTSAKTDLNPNEKIDLALRFHYTQQITKIELVRDLKNISTFMRKFKKSMLRPIIFPQLDDAISHNHFVMLFPLEI